MTELQRITTIFVDSEDRIRLAGEGAAGQALLLWLSQRLLNRVLPHLCAWLEHQAPATAHSYTDAARAEVLQSFAQLAALAALLPQAPVPSHAPSGAWLVHSVDVTTGEHAVTLTFKAAVGETHEPATLTLPEQALRQWLNILHDQYIAAEWPLTLWPEWVAQPQSSPTHAARLH